MKKQVKRKKKAGAKLEIKNIFHADFTSGGGLVSFFILGSSIMALYSMPAIYIQYVKESSEVRCSYFGSVSVRFTNSVESGAPTSGSPMCVMRLSDLARDFPSSLSDFLRLAGESAGPGQISKMHPVAGWMQRGQ